MHFHCYDTLCYGSRCSLNQTKDVRMLNLLCFFFVFVFFLFLFFFFGGGGGGGYHSADYISFPLGSLGLLWNL